MGKKAKGKHRLDWYYKLAKESGYRARSAWKLSMLDGRFRFLERSRAVLDLCAAPGGWMQIAVQRVPVNSLVIGVDIAPIIPIRGAINIKADITKPECMCRIKEHMKRYDCQYFDVILHDGSPNVSGAWDMDATCQNSLVIDSIKLATQLLRPNGTFLTKVFRSRDFMSVMYCLRQLFESVTYTKPEPSRKESAETYILCRKYKAPSNIDPRLLDIKHLFQVSEELPPKMLNLLRDNKQKRHRDGYEDGITTLRKVSSAANFIWSHAPLDILSSVTSITFADPADLPIKDHDLTTEEVTCLCDDLKVLGKQDLKNLLKWRTQIRKALSHNPDPDSTATEHMEIDDPKAVDEEDQILNEMEELTCAMDRRKKKHAKALLAKRRAKEKARKLTGMQMDALEDGYVDPELFSLSLIKCKKDLVTVDTAEYEGELEGSENEEMLDGPKHSSSDFEDSDEERKRYDDLMEELLDEAYEQYVIRKEGRTYQQKRIKKSYGEETQLLEGGEEEYDTMQSKYNYDEDQGDQERNPLVVPLNNGTELTQDEIINRWFSQDVFVEAVEEGDFENIKSKSEMDIDEPKEKTSITRKVKQNKTAALTVIETSKAAEEDFEIVAAPETETDLSDESEEEEDVETKAEILTYAKKMMGKKQRESILDDAYNKYMFDDEGLPKWFLDEEKRHRQPIKPVTKEEIAAMKVQFKEIDARPAKKVAEAKARKQRAAMRKLENVQKKANAISDQTDLPDPLKWKKIDQLYRKAVPKRPRKEYVVAKKGVQVKAGKGKVLVDRRMKKDARKRGMSKAGKVGSKMKGKAGKGGSKMKRKGYSKASAKN